MKIKSQKDFFAGLMFLVIGLAFAWGAARYSFGSSVQPGPGYIPFGLGLLLAVLGVLILFNALSIERDGGDRIGKIAWRPLIAIVAAVAVFGLALPRLGLVLTLPVVVLLSTLAGAETRLRDALMKVLVLTAGGWIVFVWALRLAVPVWPVI